MGGYSIDTILSPPAIIDRISQLDLPGTSLSKLFGFSVGNFFDQAPNSPAVDHSLRDGAYDIFDTTRRVATGRQPGAVSSMQQPQRVGQVRFTIPRSAETIPLHDERLQNQRQVGAITLDQGGLNYIVEQEKYLAQRFANLIEFQTAAMCRGSYSFSSKGDDLEHMFSGGDFTIDYQVPAGNKTTLDMLGAGAIIGTNYWSNTATDIPGQLQSINAAMVNLTGMGLKHVCLTGAGWQYVVNNTKVQQQGGSSNVVFEKLERVDNGEFIAIIRGMPWVTFHVIDYGLEVYDGSSYTFTKMIPDTRAIFLPEPNTAWVQYIRGCEWVTEGPGGAKSLRYGFYPYKINTHEPSGVQLKAVFNGFPGLKRPKAMAYGRIAAES